MAGSSVLCLHEFKLPVFSPTGKVWLIVMVLLRLLVLVFAGYPLYQDEQERFVCNTIQPGCANVCYDLFAPVSLFRFWLVQLLTLCLPSVLFIVYVVHKVSGALTVDLSSAPPLAGCFTGAYIVQLVFRTLLEAGFGAAHYYLFGFYIPRRFLCQNPPCTTQVDCYISRPTEKTVMLSFMLGAASLSLLLNMLDFIWAIKRSVRQKSRRKMMMEKLFVEEERCFLTARQTSTGTEPAPQRDLEAAPGPVESFRKRQGSRGSRAGGMLDFGPELPALEHCSLNTLISSSHMSRPVRIIPKWRRVHQFLLRSSSRQQTAAPPRKTLPGAAKRQESNTPSKQNETGMTGLPGPERPSAKPQP
uniref:Gap junction protein n=1 Tax=Salarias fasciatus TaxID=181472 RepID=A0A672IY69_SALFA